MSFLLSLALWATNSWNFLWATSLSLLSGPSLEVLSTMVAQLPSADSYSFVIEPCSWTRHKILPCVRIGWLSRLRTGLAQDGFKLTMWSSQVWNLQSSCLSIPSSWGYKPSLAGQFQWDIFKRNISKAGCYRNDLCRSWYSLHSISLIIYRDLEQMDSSLSISLLRTS